RTALKARARSLKHRVKELHPADQPRVEPPHEGWHELQPLLDEELSGLPEKYRAPIVLCDLQGKTHKEAAQQLGWPEGTLSSRLVAARGVLGKRLARRGVDICGTLLGSGLLKQTVSLPASLVASTVKAASVPGTALGAAAGVPASVTVLAKGVLKI